MNIYIREVSRQLGAMNVAVDVFTRHQGSEAPEVEPFAENARVIHVPAGPRHYLPKEKVVDHLPEFICNMRELIARDSASYDVVHSHYWLSGRVAGYFKNAWHVPMVAMFHTLAELKNQVSLSAQEWESDLRVGIERLTVATADRLVASTPVDRAHLERHYGADGGRVTIVPCGVDYELFHPGPSGAARRALGLENVPTVLFVGRIQQLKGLEILIRATAVLAARDRGSELPGFQVCIVGGRPSGARDDPERKEIQRLQALARRLGVADYIRWAGAVDHEVLPAYYQAADVTVMPSTYESFGLVAIESMACGTPVVAARVGGLQATVQDGRTGYLIPWRDPTLYADRIADILTQREVATRMSVDARARAMTFGWPRVAEQLIELYEDLLAAQAGGIAQARTPG